MTRWLVPLPDLPHRPICRFDVTPEPIRIEQRISETVGFKLATDGGELRRRKGEFQRERLIFLEIAAHELRQSDGVQQACRCPTRERFAQASGHRKPRPERVARRAMGIVGERIEEQIGQPLARQMLRRGCHPLANMIRAGSMPRA